MCGGNGLNRVVLIVFNIIKRRYIHTLNLCRLNKKILLAVAVFSALTVKLHNLQIHLFALAYKKQVDKIGNRLRVTGTGPAGTNYIFKLCSVLGFYRNTRQLEHIQYICKAKLILQCKADKIKFRKRIAAFKSKQRNIVFNHKLLHVYPWGKNTLTPYIFLAVKQTVEYFHTQVGHTHLVNIGKAKGKA